MIAIDIFCVLKELKNNIIDKMPLIKKDIVIKSISLTKMLNKNNIIVNSNRFLCRVNLLIITLLFAINSFSKHAY